MADITGVPADTIRSAARALRTGGNAAFYYGARHDRAQPGQRPVIAIANSATADGNIGRPGVGVKPVRGQNNVQAPATWVLSPRALG